MKSAKKGLLFIPLVLFSLPAFSQFYYDVFGHKIAYQQGNFIFDTTGVKIGEIEGSCATLIVGDSSTITLCLAYRRKGEYIYAVNPNDPILKSFMGSIEACKIYDGGNNLIGITDGKIMDDNAIVFYFGFLPRYRYFQVNKLLKTGK